MNSPRSTNNIEIEVGSKVIFQDYSYLGGKSQVVLSEGIVDKITEKQINITNTKTNCVRYVQRYKSMFLIHVI